MRTAHRLAVLAALSAVAWCMSGALAQPESLQFLEPRPGEERQALSFAEGEENRELDVTVLNASSYTGPLAARLIVDGTETALDTGVSEMAPHGVAAFTLAIPRDVLSEEQEGTDGTLIVEGTREDAPLPATLAVTLSSAPAVAEPDWTTVTAEPAKVNMLVTNYVPSLMDTTWARRIMGALGVILLALVFRGRRIVTALFPAGDTCARSRELSVCASAGGVAAPGRWASWNALAIAPGLIAASLILASVAHHYDEVDTRRGDEQEVRLYGIGQQDAATAIQRAEPGALLAESHGESATAELTVPERVETPEAGFAQGDVTLTSVSGPGEFAGDLLLAPSVDNAATVSVRALVRDWWYWPLLAALLGTWIGWIINSVYERRRSRELMRSTLCQTVEQYLDARAALDASVPFHDLFEPSAPVAGAANRSLSCRYHALRERVNDVHTKEGMESLAREIVDLQNMVGSWPALCRAGAALQRLHDRAEGELEALDASIAPLQPLLATSKMLLIPGLVAPGQKPDEPPAGGWPPALKSAVDIEQRTAEIGAMSSMMITLLRALQLTAMATAAFEPIRKGNEKLDPQELLRARVVTATDEGSLAALLGLVAENFEAILDASDETVSEAMERMPADESLKGFLDVVPLPMLPVERISTMSAAQMIDRIRGTDMLVSGAAILLAAVAFLLTKYSSDAAFGRWPQYLGIITTAAAATTILESVVLPWARSYTLKGGESAPSESAKAA
jgi:hypothetical protein